MIYNYILSFLALATSAWAGTATTTVRLTVCSSYQDLTNRATLQSYYDNTVGACGCGNDAGAFGWQSSIGTGIYTAA